MGIILCVELCVKRILKRVDGWMMECGDEAGGGKHRELRIENVEL